MIEYIDLLEVSINERLQHLAMLNIDAEQLGIVIKDEQKKRSVVRNFRIIKNAEKQRSINQAKYLQLIAKCNKKLTKGQVNICENMLVSCINQYLNTQFQTKNNGDLNDIINAFAYYYLTIKCQSRLNQCKVVRNCKIFYQTSFMSDNLSFFISNMQETMSYVYQNEKTKFFNMLKLQNRTISPQKRGGDDQDDQKFDKSGLGSKKKRKLQIYCFQLSKLLHLQHIYLDYFYFNSLQIQKRKKVLQGNFTKRNLYIRKEIQSYFKDYQSFKLRQKHEKKKKQKEQKEQKSLQGSQQRKISDQITPGFFCL